MLEIKGNLWDFHKKGHLIAVTTNHSIKANGCNVMGKGIAKEAADRFPNLPKQFGRAIEDDKDWCKRNPNKEPRSIHLFPEYNLFTFQVKRIWQEPATLELIDRSCRQLLEHLNAEKVQDCIDDWLPMGAIYKDLKYPICLTKAGCGNGLLNWKDVKPIFENYFKDDDRIIVVYND